jgi:superfamily II DNA or RNA helicase
VGSTDPPKRQTRFGQPGAVRQTTLADLLAELPLPETGLVGPPAEAVPRRPTPRAPKAVPRPPVKLTEFGEAGRIARERVAVEAPVPERLQATLVGPPTEEAKPRILTAERLPAEVVERWKLEHALRPYQVEALDAFLNATKGSVILPTGVGKTLVGIAAILAVRLPTVVIVPTRVLVTQWSEELRKTGITPGVWYGEEKSADYVTVSTYQSLFEDPELIRGFPFIIFDEGDLATGDQFRALIAETFYHAYALLLTATPPSEADRRRLMEQELPIVYQWSAKQAIEAGALVEPVVVPERVSLTGAEQAEYDRADKTIHAMARYIGGASPRLAALKTRSGDPEIRSAAFAFLKAFNARKKVVSGAVNKLPTLLRIVQSRPGERVLLFSESVETLEAACGYLTANGVSCRLLISETSAESRRSIIRGWGTEFQVLGSVRVLERGFNVPEAAVGVILASGSGRTQLTQRLGRIVRPAPGKAQAFIYVVLANNTVEENMLKALERLTGSGAAALPGPPVEDDE